MDLWLTRALCRCVPSRRAGVAVLAAVLVVPLAPAAYAAVLPSAETQAEAAERERQAAFDLAESSAEVRAAAAALQKVAAELPRARADVARARGELAGARAKVAAANAAVARAEAARAAAEQEVAAADVRVDQGREDVGQLARRAYQRGRLGDLREVVEAGEPQDVLERASMIRKVFEHQDASLARLARDRLALARKQAGLAAERRAVARARARAQDGEDRARQITAEAEAAADRVAQLAATKAAALRSAESARAADERDYAEAQAASRALAERIREAARKAAAAEAQRRAQEEAARVAAQKAAERAAAERARKAAAAGRPAPPPPAPRRTQPQPSRAEREDQMLWPCRGCPLTSRYGYRRHPIYGDRRFHAGIDMGASTGTPVRSSDAGTVIFAGYASGYGTLVVVSHGVVDGRDLSTAYAHMSTISVSEGQRVRRGQKVGEVGNEGNSTGPHLHFEVRRDGDPVDPLDYVDPP